jgi:acyl-CoA synthetase (AMP-forming)/AMP-acid ligase II
MSDFFAGVAARSLSSVAGWRGAEAVSMAAFRARVCAWRALALRTPGRHAALYLDDSVEFGAALLGAWLAGKTVWLTADTLDASCAALAAGVDAFFGEFPAACQPLLPAVDGHCVLDWAAPAPDFMALVVHTSGSTGKPAAIHKRLSQLTSEVATLERLFGTALGQADVLATVSHQHIYGLLFKVLWPLAAGRAIHAASIVYPEQLAAALAQRPCILVASPAHLKRLPEHLDWSAAAAMLRAVFSSGGPLTPDASVAAARLLAHTPTEIYGSSETGGIAWRSRQAGGSGAWEALPGVEWRIDSGGQLEVRSPHLDSDAWLHMADRVEPAPGGHFMLLGRSDRIVKIEEKRISLDAVEAALVAGGMALEARVLLCPQAAGERQALAAFVVLSAAGRAQLQANGKQAVNRQLRTQLAAVVETVALPRRWRYLDQLPVNAQGKTTHAQLLALLDGAPAAPPRLPSASVIEQHGERVLLGITVPSTLFYLEGHFPQAPILPGVVQVDWAIHYGRAHFALAPQFRGINALKFQQVILPDSPLYLELVHDSAKGSLQFRYFSDTGPHAGGRILFGS